MASYLDVLTILLILFIAVAARAVQPQIAGNADRTVTPKVAPPVRDSKPDPVRLALLAKGLDLRREQWGLVISLPQAVVFPSGGERVPASALPAVEEIANVLRTIPNKVNLAGNADSTAIHSRRFRNNWELSAARGMALLSLLTTKYGIEESRLSVTSHGSHSPRGSNKSAEGRAENRRVEITILDLSN